MDFGASRHDHEMFLAEYFNGEVWKRSGVWMNITIPTKEKAVVRKKNLEQI